MVFKVLPIKFKNLNACTDKITVTPLLSECVSTFLQCNFYN